MTIRPTPATNESAGPFRKVVDVIERPGVWPERWELLECGHYGHGLRSRHSTPRKRRRCWFCITRPTTTPQEG